MTYSGPTMGLEKPQSLALRDLIDADALRRDLTALARETGDPGTLRKSGLILIKAAFSAGPREGEIRGGEGGPARPGRGPRPVAAAGQRDPGDL